MDIQKELEILEANPIISSINLKNDLAKWQIVSDYVDDNYPHLSTIEKGKLIGKILESV